MSHDQVWHMIPWYVNGRAEQDQRERIEAHMRVCDECRNEVTAQRQIMNAIANDKRIDSVPGVAFQRLWERITHDASLMPDEAEAEPGTQSASTARVRTELGSQSVPNARVRTEPAREHASNLSARAARVNERVPVGAASKRPRAPVITRWLAAAVVIEAIGISVLAVALRSDEGVTPPTAQFRTVTSAAPVTGRGDIRAVFSPEVPVSELQRLLEQSGLQIVGGPTEAGVYTLASATPATPGLAETRRDAALAGLRASPAVRFAEPISR